MRRTRAIGVACILLLGVVVNWQRTVMSQYISATALAEGGNPTNVLSPPWDQDWAWEGEPDCEDPKATYDEDCWACEGSPPEAVPKFNWEKKIIQCPELKVKPNTNASCICLQAAQDGTTNVLTMTASAPGYEMTQIGKSKWTPDPAKCGTEHVEEFGFSEVKWTWTVEGVTARPQSGEGETANFEYDVPDSAFTLAVNFEATGKPEEPNDCPESKDSGPGAVVVGSPYNRLQLELFDCAKDVPVTYADWLPDGEGDAYLGKFEGGVVLAIWPEPVCQGTDPDCTRWRITGDVVSWGIITISRNNLVVGNNCSPNQPGSLRPRLPEHIDGTIEHEKKHCLILENLVNKYKHRIMNSPFFATELECEIAVNLMKIDFDIDFANFKYTQETHCPDFHGMPDAEVKECGDEDWESHKYECF